MEIYVIKQKQSNTGSIHDLASQHYERDIHFRHGTHYAVVHAAYYCERTGANLYTTHVTEQAAAQASRKLSANDISHEIIDNHGRRYMANWDTLHRID